MYFIRKYKLVNYFINIFIFLMNNLLKQLLGFIFGDGKYVYYSIRSVCLFLFLFCVFHFLLIIIYLLFFLVFV